MSPVGGPAVGKPTSNRARAPLKWATLGLLSHWGFSLHGAPAAPSPADAVYHVTAICVYGSTCVNIGVALSPGVRSRSFYVLRARTVRVTSGTGGASPHPLETQDSNSLFRVTDPHLFWVSPLCETSVCAVCVCADRVGGSGGSARSARLK